MPGSYYIVGGRLNNFKVSRLLLTSNLDHKTIIPSRTSLRDKSYNSKRNANPGKNFHVRHFGCLLDECTWQNLPLPIPFRSPRFTSCVSRVWYIWGARHVSLLLRYASRLKEGYGREEPIQKGCLRGDPYHLIRSTDQNAISDFVWVGPVYSGAQFLVRTNFIQQLYHRLAFTDLSGRFLST